jgi:transposase-like protein
MAQEVYRSLGGEVKWKSSIWHMGETFMRIAGRWMYLFCAVDSAKVAALRNHRPILAPVPDKNPD